MANKEKTDNKNKTDTTNKTISCIVCKKKFNVTNDLEDFDKICKSGVIIISKQSKMYLPSPNEQGGIISKIDGFYCSPLCLMKHTFKRIQKYNKSDDSVKLFAKIKELAESHRTSVLCDDWAKNNNISSKQTKKKVKK